MKSPFHPLVLSASVTLISSLALPATDFSVTSDADAGPGTLRAYIEDANTTPGADEIHFALDPGPHILVLLSALPPIVDPVIIDATTQPGFTGTPIIEISGENLLSPYEHHGLLIFSGRCTVRGLVINRFPGAGIVIVDGGTNVVEACYVGTDLGGTQSAPNLSGGLYITSPGNQVGGTRPGSGNLVSGNFNGGLIFDGENATNNLAVGNTIGLSADGSQAVGNMVAGVIIHECSYNQIGGASPESRNTIAGNDDIGVFIVGLEARFNRILGNHVGVDASGLSRGLGNLDTGIVIQSASDNEVGGAIAHAGNIVSANGGNGIEISGIEAEGNRIQGNLIGLGADGDKAMGNGRTGILIAEGPHNVVGGKSPDARNVIGANGQAGIQIAEPSATENRIYGNWVGIDASGRVGRPNGFFGIEVNAPATIVGGADAGEGNVCSGNQLVGIHLAGPVGSNAVVLGNRVGVDPTGLHPIPNGLQGIFIEAVAGAIIGGIQPGTGNQIAGNGQSGITVLESRDIRIVGNSIGISADGTTPLGNSGDGIRIRGSSRIQIGQRTPAIGNVIAYNLRAGISAESDTPPHRLPTQQCEFVANSIFDNGELAVDLMADGPTANDRLDEDTGPNFLQNFPILEYAAAAGRNSVTAGQLESAPNSDYWIDFYLGETCGNPARPKCRQYLGGARIHTDATGKARFRVAFRDTEAAAGQSMAATATDESGNTSELSPCLAVDAGLSLSIRVTHDVSPAGLELTWTDPAGDAVLEQSNDVAAPAAWTDVGLAPDINGEQRSVSLPLAQSARFFRLRR